MAPLLHRDLRHPWLKYQVNGYDEDSIRQTLRDRLSMVYAGDDRHALFISHAWRRLFEVRAPLVREFMLEFFSTGRMSDTEMGLDVADILCLHSEEEMAEARFGAYWSGSERVIPDKGDLRDYWMEISSDRDFLGPAPLYVHIIDPVRRLCHMMIACSISGRGQGAEKVTKVDLFYLRTMDRGTANVPYLLAKYLFRHAEGRKSEARLSGGHFIGRQAAHFGLVGDQGLRGLSVVVSELPVIDLHELAMLNICSRFGDTWAWIVLGPERQQAIAVGAPGAVEDASAADEGAQAVPAPVQAPQPSPPAPQHQTMSQRIEEELMDASGRTYQAFDITFVGSSQLPYLRRIRPRTGEANTSTAPQTED
ncbi:hypothetical protein Tco_0088835 [Tanacetum coccineum]